MRVQRAARSRFVRDERSKTQPVTPTVGKSQYTVHFEAREVGTVRFDARNPCHGRSARHRGRHCMEAFGTARQRGRRDSLDEYRTLRDKATERASQRSPAHEPIHLCCHRGGDTSGRWLSCRRHGVPPSRETRANAHAPVERSLSAAWSCCRDVTRSGRCSQNKYATAKRGPS